MKVRQNTEPDKVDKNKVGSLGREGKGKRRECATVFCIYTHNLTNDEDYMSNS